MQQVNVRKYAVLFTLLSAVLFLSNSSNPPDGRTGAPFDGLCSDCHGGGSFQGTVAISGIPTTITPNTTYNVTLTLTATSGSPSFGGFQIVTVNSSNQNAGDLINTSGQTGTSVSGGREYLDQRGGKAFSGGAVSWNFDWKSPNGPNNEMFTLYFAGNFTNGNNSSSGDAVESASFTTTMMGGGNPLVATIGSKTNVSCFGGMDGTATASATGGNPPYSYSWSTGSSDNPVTGLGMGTYTVTVTDNAASTATATVMITQPTLLQHTTQITRNVSCPGGKDGAVSSVGIGGTPPYSYNYSTGSSNNLSAGMYSVTVSDSKGCESSSTFEITQPEPFQIEELVFDHPTCPNALNGQIQVFVRGGTSPYKYKWSSNETINIISNKGIGNYKLTITDAKNCNALKSYDLTSQDTTPPLLVGKNGVIYLNEMGYEVVQLQSFIDRLMDNCDSLPIVQINADTFFCKNIGSNQLILTAKDQLGNTSRDTIVVDVRDTLKPMLDAWKDSLIFACNTVLPQIKATDNCSLTEFLQVSGPKDVPFIPVGQHIFAYKATDQSGNTQDVSFQVKVENPLKLHLDTITFQPCYGDSARIQLSASHQLKNAYYFIHLGDSILLHVDTQLHLTTVRPDTFEVFLADSNLCQTSLSQHYTYPDSSYQIDSVVIQDEVGANKGSIHLFPASFDSIHILQDTLFINNTGEELSAGQYYLHVYVNMCTYVFGPYTVDLVIQAGNPIKNARSIAYPNPVNEQLNILSSQAEQLIHYQLLNAQGKPVIQNGSFAGKIKIDVRHLASGYYILVLQDQEGIQALQLTKL